MSAIFWLAGVIITLAATNARLNFDGSRAGWGHRIACTITVNDMKGLQDIAAPESELKKVKFSLKAQLETELEINGEMKEES